MSDQSDQSDIPGQPPPLPHAPPTNPGLVSRPVPGNDLESYNTVAETVGFMPSLRLKDNVVQAAIIIGSVAIAAPVGYFMNGRLGAAAYGAGAMIVSFFVSGVVLMVLGWVRAAKKRR